MRSELLSCLWRTRASSSGLARGGGRGVYVGLSALKLFLVAALVSTAAHATLESEEELRAIEKAHAAVTEIEADFHQALAEAQKKGELRKALPGCRIKNLRPDEMKVGRTSHRLRNTNNAPPEWTKPYLEKFSKSKRSEIPKHVLTKISHHRYGLYSTHLRRTHLPQLPRSIGERGCQRSHPQELSQRPCPQFRRWGFSRTALVRDEG
jgi:hypothetical protein